MISEPLAGRRETVVTKTRTAKDFAKILKYTSDVLHPGKKIIPVTDNLNIHTPASLYKTFKPEEARRLAERFEWHYTPKHGSWLDMITKTNGEFVTLLESGTGMDLGIQFLN